MRLPNNLGLKIYITIFTIVTACDLMSLSITQGIAFFYYNILLVFNKPSGIWYALALINTLVTCICIIPLVFQASNSKPRWVKFFQKMFFIRLATTVVGHNYEIIAIKSAFLGTPIIGFLSIGIWLLFNYPSFKQHFIYAFRNK